MQNGRMNRSMKEFHNSKNIPNRFNNTISAGPSDLATQSIEKDGLQHSSAYGYPNDLTRGSE